MAKGGQGIAATNRKMTRLRVLVRDVQRAAHRDFDAGRRDDLANLHRGAAPQRADVEPSPQAAANENLVVTGMLGARSSVVPVGGRRIWASICGVSPGPPMA